MNPFSDRCKQESLVDNQKIYLDEPNLGELEKDYLVKCVESNFVSTAGPFVPEFEQKFADYVGAKAAVAVQSGTAALHMALHALDIGPGDEVIVPALTFIATVNPVLYTGATPVIVDVNTETWNIDPYEVEKAISPKTKAIIPVHLYGNPCHMTALTEIAQKNSLHIIEDATESLGALWKGKHTGTFGDFGCFSFNGNKLITTGGGGMIVTNDEEKAARLKFLVNQARDISKGYYHPEMGYNNRMTNIEAALGLAQLSRLEDFLRLKREFAAAYQKGVGDIPGIEAQTEYEEADSSFWLNCIRFTGRADVDEIANELRQSGIPTRRVFMPLGEMPYLRRFAKDCYRALQLFQHGICLPSSTLNSSENIARSCLALRRVIGG